MPKTEADGHFYIPEYDNPFIDPLPPILSLRSLQESFDRPPLLTEEDRRRPRQVRQHLVFRLINYSQPTVAGRDLARKIEIMIRRGYVGRHPTKSDWFWLQQDLAARERSSKARGSRSVDPLDWPIRELAPEQDTAFSCLVVGPPGTGKTHSVKVTLARYKQVIHHTAPFVLAQIVWLRLECPPTGSLIALCKNFFEAVDRTLTKAGFKSNLSAEYRRATLPVLLTGMARVASLHAIGLLVIDEMQHIKNAHSESSQLLNFMVTLRNTIGIPIVMVGTMSILPIVQRTFRDARRADGIGSILFERMRPAPMFDLITSGRELEEVTTPEPIYGADFHAFVTNMWEWQYTSEVTQLNDEILNALYDETQGIADLVVKLFMLVQIALMDNSAKKGNPPEIITPDSIRETAKLNFNSVKPFIAAFRNNDQQALLAFEDLGDLHSWFNSYMTGVGDNEGHRNRGSAFGDDKPLPPIQSGGTIVPSVLDTMLEGLHVPPELRSDFIGRHAEMIEAGDLIGIVNSAKDELANIKTEDRRNNRPVRKPPVEDDLRTLFDGADDESVVNQRVRSARLDDWKD